MSNLSIQIEVKKSEQTGDLYIELPKDVLDSMKWSTGDNVTLDIQHDRTIIIKKSRYQSVELDIDENELAKWMMAAHEENITFNQFVERALKEIIENEE